eukprot:TRINITY_DN1979_c1_g1_i1.p1 TRINITY_DN1979_c1_g1~~TRINITY_DN1979_c1_g1_i1.p1  ORF type:complete len:456 (+),score=129.65 TRINITY_DN1979_c1_g1_i1:412-1779(+)
MEAMSSSKMMNKINRGERMSAANLRKGFDRRAATPRSRSAFDVIPDLSSLSSSSVPVAVPAPSSRTVEVEGVTVSVRGEESGEEEGEIERGEVGAIFRRLLAFPTDSDLHVFFTCYRGFIEAEELVEMMTRYRARGSKLDHLVDVLSVWLLHPEDLFDQPLLLPLLLHFLDSFERLCDPYSSLPPRIDSLRSSFIKVGESRATPAPSLVITTISVPSTSKVDVLGMTAQDVASVFTFIDHEMFCRVLPSDILHKDRQHKRHVDAMIQRFNSVSGWIATEIVTTTSLKKRSSLIRHFINVASCLSKMHNYNSMLAITAGLNMSVVQRLRKTWKMVPKKQMDDLQELEDLMDCRSNYKIYRHQLEHSPLPCVPYFGIFLRDLTFIDIGNEDLTAKGELNFAKMRMRAETVKELKKFQSVSYDVVPRSSFVNYLSNVVVFDESTLYKHSVVCEPPSEV